MWRHLRLAASRGTTLGMSPVLCGVAVRSGGSVAFRHVETVVCLSTSCRRTLGQFPVGHPQPCGRGCPCTVGPSVDVGPSFCWYLTKELKCWFMGDGALSQCSKQVFGVVGGGSFLFCDTAQRHWLCPWTWDSSSVTSTLPGSRKCARPAPGAPGGRRVGFGPWSWHAGLRA